MSSPRVGWLRNERTRRRAGWTLGGSAVTALLCWSLMFPFDSRALFITSLVAAFVAIVSATIIGASAHSAARRTPGSVEVNDGQIIVTEASGVARVPLSEVVDGWLEHPHEVRVRLSDGRVLAVEAPDGASAEALLAAAGVGPGQRVLTVPLSSTASLTRGGVPMNVLGIALLSPFVLSFVSVTSIGVVDMLANPSGAGIMALLFMLMIVAAGAVGIAKLVDGLRLGRAIVGVDGVTVKRGLRSTFIPYTSITRVEPSARGVLLHQHDGPPVELATWRRGEPALAPGAAPSKGDSEGERRQRVLIDRIERASRASRRSSTDLAMLDRSGRSIESWRDEVSSLAGRDGSFRVASLTTADLADVVEDVEAPAERRIAATMAVADSGDTAAKQRMRIAIDTCANDELRVALERAAEAELEEDDLERVIRE